MKKKLKEAFLPQRPSGRNRMTDFGDDDYEYPDQAQPPTSLPEDPELEKDVQELLNKLRMQLNQIQSSTPPGNRPQALPWLQHGTRGFLRKLWYGNSQQNPDWDNYPKEHAQHVLTLREYAETHDYLSSRIDIMISEADAATSTIDNILQSFGAELKQVIMKHIQKARGTPQAKTEEPKAKSPETKSPETQENATPAWINSIPPKDLEIWKKNLEQAIAKNGKVCVAFGDAEDRMEGVKWLIQQMGYTTGEWEKNDTGEACLTAQKPTT